MKAPSWSQRGDTSAADVNATVHLGHDIAREALYDDEGDNVDDDALMLADEGWVTWLCGSGVKLAHVLKRELSVASVAALLAVVSAIFGASCTDPARCNFLSAPISQWILFASFSVVVAIPGRVIDRALFSVIQAISQVVTFSFLLPIYFYTLSFEGVLARFWWLLITWDATDRFLSLGSNQYLLDNVMRTLLVFQLLATLHSLALRVMMRTVLIGSFEGKIDEILFNNLVLLAVAKPHPVGMDGRLTLERDTAWRELRRLHLSSDFRLKLDACAKLRFRLYNKVRQ